LQIKDDVMQTNRHALPGVTLLEIMLVLAIAALVVVMSIRYYVSGVTAQQANSVLSQMQAMVNAASTIAGESGDYSLVNSTNVANQMPNHSLATPWGTNMTVSGTGSTFTVNIPGTPFDVCTILSARLSADNHYDLSATTCPSTGSVTYTYTYNAGA
jgi:type II secretory pathway pseudopilin PulG